MVEPVAPIAASAGSTPTQPHSSLSIGSEAFNVWVAARQSKITAQLQARAEENADAGAAHTETEDLTVNPENGPRPDHAEHAADREHSAAEGRGEPATLSGESDNIGKVNFDDDTPFGDRVAFL